MMKHQTHSSPLITNGLTGNDDDNARVCTPSSIAISLLLTFAARPGKSTSANSSLARPRTFHELSKTAQLYIPGRARRDPSGSERIALFSRSCLNSSISCFLSGLDFPSQCQASISSSFCVALGQRPVFASDMEKHTRENKHCWSFFFFFIRESERDGYSGSGQELRWSVSSDF